MKTIKSVLYDAILFFTYANTYKIYVFIYTDSKIKHAGNINNDANNSRVIE